MEASEEEGALPWRWILEHLVDMKDIGTSILRELMTYIPNIGIYVTLQKRVAIRYLEEEINGGHNDARIVPLLELLLKESQKTSSYPTSSDYRALLLRVHVEAVITHIRAKPRDWLQFSHALDLYIGEDSTEAQYLEKRKELSTLLQIRGPEKKCAEVLETYSLTSLRSDLLQCLSFERRRLGRTFLDKLLQDVRDGKYPLPEHRLVPEKTAGQEKILSADGRTVISDGQTGVEERTSKEAVETNQKDLASTERQGDDHTVGGHGIRHKKSSQKPDLSNMPAKRMKHGPEQRSVSLRERDEHGKAVTSGSPIKGVNRETNVMPCSPIEGVKKSANKGVREVDKHAKAVTSGSPIKDVSREPNVTSHSPMEGVSESDDSRNGVGPMGESNEGFSLREGIPSEIGEDSLRVELLEVGSDGHEESCHKCKEGGRLICCDGCPIAVHRRCLGSEASSVREEQWFCPWCVHKRAAEAVAKARVEELTARQGVLRFMAGSHGKGLAAEHMAGLDGKGPAEHQRMFEQKFGKETAVDDTDHGFVAGLEKWTSHSDAQQRAGELPSDGRGRPPYKRTLDKVPPADGHEPSDSSEGIDLNSMDGRKGKRKEDSTRQEAVDHEGKRKEQTRRRETIEQETVNEAVDDEGKRKEQSRRQEAIDQETEQEPSVVGDAHVGRTCHKRTSIASSSKADESLQQRENINVGEGDRHDGDLEEEGRKSDTENPMKSRENRTFPGMRRKRLRWSKEEEDTLKEGVMRFSRDNGGWGFQWKRILEFGKGKFDASRTDVDLKDKWRNLAKRLN